MKQGYLCWAHGLDAQPWGEKSKAMAETAKDMGLELDAPDFRGMTDPDQRVEKLLGHIKGKKGPIVLAGSSMGGYVCAAAAQEVEVAGLFLVAPAFYLPGYQQHVFFNLPETIKVVHGWKDVVVPVENSIRFAKLHNAALHILPGDHRLGGLASEVAFLFSGFLNSL
ncbi:YqiA/YcfP family alpha/beta fold hydrolase [Salidesulfovibrio onnuriiensis]|uniref:YqiA/YcfP family alpha/beta fold hydrolase n=1 Tax=Salidesulfovibrio onnuriiensis TaxID=2583823 RepID=UPI00164F6750|nr:alpha/beta fold hydrolase [Salidesulfovibrio onnuriiensis]